MKFTQGLSKCPLESSLMILESIGFRSMSLLKSNWLATRRRELGRPSQGSDL